jgi:hypothetical protein
MKHRNNNEYHNQRNRLNHIVQLMEQERRKLDLSSRDDLDVAISTIKLIIAAVDANESSRALINDTDGRC